MTAVLAGSFDRTTKIREILRRGRCEHTIYRYIYIGNRYHGGNQDGFRHGRIRIHRQPLRAVTAGSRLRRGGNRQLRKQRRQGADSRQPGSGAPHHRQGDHLLQLRPVGHQAAGRHFRQSTIYNNHILDYYYYYFGKSFLQMST